MGCPIPKKPAKYEPEKYYVARVSGFQSPYGPTGCDGTYIADVHGICTGEYINDWLELGLECKNGWELIPLSGYTAQRLGSVKGPFDDYDDAYDYMIAHPIEF